MKIFRHYIFPIATLASSIIGVGFLSLPYVAAQVGWPLMLAYFFLLTFVIIMVHQMFAHVCLKTPDFKRWPGFVGFYFGPIPRRLVMVLMAGGIYGVMVIYLVVGSNFLATALAPFFGGEAFHYALLYFTLGSLCIFGGIKIVSRVDFLGLGLLGVMLAIIANQGFSHIQAANVTFFAAPGANVFLPYGAMLFSLWGSGLIPETEEMLRGNKKALPLVISIATLIPAVFYLIFTFLVVSISGENTAESALQGLARYLGHGPMLLALLMGTITTFLAFIAQGLLLKKIFMYDVGMQPAHSWALAVLPPLALFLFGVTSFIPLVSFIGGVLLSVDGLLILLMYCKVGGKKLFAYPLILVFLAGLAYSLFSLTF